MRSARIATVLTLAALITPLAGCAGRQAVAIRDDATITSDIRAQMAADTQLSTSGIKVDTKEGVVQLTGSVPSDDLRNAAGRVALATPGVRSVDNDVVFGMGVPPAKMTE